MRPQLDKIVALDFESFYSTEFSLTKQEYNTSSYVRDPQFKTHCCAIKIGKRKSRCYTGKAMIDTLKAVDWSTHAVLAHNTAFDGLILKELYDIVPVYYYDTLSMTRGLHNEVSRAKLDTIAKFYGLGSKHEGALENTKGKRDLNPAELKRLMEYCNNDNELCYQVFLKQLEIYPEDELDLIDLTIRMFCDPVLMIDEPVAQLALAEEMIERRATILKANATEKELSSNASFAALLKKCGVEPPTKISNKLGTEIFAFAQSDPEFIDLQNHEDIRVVRLVQARLAAKSTQAETRAHRLLQAGAGGKKLPVGYNYFGAKTGRWSGTNKLNLQNLPRVNKKEPKPSDGLRQSIIAPPCHVLVVTDSAQIEARIIAWLCGQLDVVEQFATGQDVYKLMASVIYQKAAEDITPLERFIGKIAVLGLGYGMGHKKFQTTLALGIMGPTMDITLKEAQRIVRLYRARNHKIKNAWDMLNDVLGVMSHMKEDESIEIFDGLITVDRMTVWLPNGMGLHYPGLHHDEQGNFMYKANGVWKKIYGGLLLENIVQALARVVVGEQMLSTQKVLKTINLKKNEVARVSLMTHDEIVSCVPECLAEKVLKAQLIIMRTPPHNWGESLPLDAEGGFARNYSK
jgi:DNA polymerase